MKNHFTEKRTELLLEQAKNHILILDGAMGTMIQRYSLSEDDFRGSRFASHHLSLRGNNDILVLTQPDVIREIHTAYLQAGADIIETNTFNAQAISQSDYGLSELCYELNYAAATIAKKCCLEITAENLLRPRFVAGSIGPTNRTASLSPDAADPARRNITFQELVTAYKTQMKGLWDGGCDLFLIETVFDTLNAKAALFAASSLFEDEKARIPVMLSLTISDQSGRTLSGQTLDAFMVSVSHFPFFSVGLNCAFGAEQIGPWVEELCRISPFRVSVYPNAGLPNALGGYDETPAQMATIIRQFAQRGLVNIVGGCCGTTPDHINEFSKSVKDFSPRILPEIIPETKICGWEVVTMGSESNFINIGERTNVAGSRKFASLIKEHRYEEALSVARQQIEGGASVIDISLDDGLIDAVKEIEIFLNWIASDPVVAAVPVMIDSSRWEVLEKGLQCMQGKGIVNSISLKEGEEDFIKKAALIHNYGACVVVMAFDEEGQAVSTERKISVCRRAYDILVKKVNFPPQDIIFDANILTIGTGVAAHNEYAVAFIEACKWIKNNLPHAKLSGGISNLSFAFRGNEPLRQALHSVFLYHAIQAGLDMGIVNAGALPVYDSLDASLRELAEDLVLNRNPEATEKLLQYSATLVETETEDIQKIDRTQNPVSERLADALVKGEGDFLDTDLNEALDSGIKALTLIEGALMTGMARVGELFGAGKMFLPQVMKSARVMKKAVEILQPYLEKDSPAGVSKSGKVLLATVKGDVHDIGKNIVGIILSCNNYEIIDLGIMTPREKILEEAIKNKVDIVGLSGLITPSLDEMIFVAKGMEEKGLHIPLLIGGATTSKLHTAVKIAPVYSGPVVHVRDASQSVGVISSLLNPAKINEFTSSVNEEYIQLREAFAKRNETKKKRTPEDAYFNRFTFNSKEASVITPARPGMHVFRDYLLREIAEYIDWTYFFYQWRMKGVFPEILEDKEKGGEAKKLYNDAILLLDDLIKNDSLKAHAVAGIFPATSHKNGVDVDAHGKRFHFEFERNLEIKPEGEPNLSLADFIAPAGENIADYLGFFALSAGFGTVDAENEFKQKGDDYSAIMVRIIADRLAEAFAELLHEKIRKEIWAYAPNENLSKKELLSAEYRGIRPAPGYPACPDHFLKKQIFELLEAEKNCGITLTESYAMIPAASVSGFYFAHPRAKYFGVE